MKRVVVEVLLVVLLASMLYSAFKIMPTEASGAIYIRADGSIDPPSVPIQRSGNLYILTGSVQNCIVIQKDNVIINGQGFTLQDLGNETGIDLTNRRNVTVSNLEITGCSYGIRLNSSSGDFIYGNNINYSSLHGIALVSSSNDNVISGNKIANNDYEGIFMDGSSRNTISENGIKGNGEDGISISYSSENNTVFGNNITDNMEHGIYLHYSSNNNISGNTFRNNFVFGIYVYFSSGNIIYHNNFYNRDYVSSYSLWKNTWDAGYPSGGNYWSDYKGKDLYSGPYQNETGSDGIGDTSYAVGANNVDNYPMKNPVPYTLTITSTIGGTTTPLSGAYTYTAGTIVQVTALPDSGHELDYWILDGSLTSPANPISVLMNCSHALQATFVLLPSVTISPTSATIDLGQSQTFNSTALNGKSPYTYEWFLDGNAVYGANRSSWTFTPTSAGDHPVYLTITDTNGKSSTSNTINVEINPALSVTLSPSSVGLDAGQSQLFTCVVSGGTSPYSYQWYVNGIPARDASFSAYMFNRSSAGLYTISVYVMDEIGVTAKSGVSSATVNPALSAGISPLSTTIDVGQSRLFTSYVSGGTSPYNYQWYLNGTAVFGATSPSWTFAPDSSDFYNISVNVTDGVGVRTESNIATVAVNPALSVGLLPASIVMDVGQSQSFMSTASGGTPSYIYQWYLNSALVSSAKNQTWAFTPALAGSYTVYIKVTDNTGLQLASDNVTVTVNAPLLVTIAPAYVALDVSQSQLFTCKISGGTPPYTYRWYLNGNLILGATGSTWTFSSTSAGSYTIFVAVTDSATNSTSFDSNVASTNVNSPPSIRTSPSSIIMSVGQSQLFTSIVSGGTSPYSYQWYLNGVPVSGATDATWNWTSSSAGSDSIYVTVCDNVGVQATSNNTTATVKIHDVAITNVRPLKTVVSQNFHVGINVTVADQGDYTETFNVTVYANTTFVASQTITLSSGSSTTMTFTWSTTGFAYGNYTLNAHASPVPGETNTTNNVFTGGSISVTVQGDVNGDGKVNVLDLISVATHLGQSNRGNYAPYSQSWYKSMNCDVNGDGTINVLDLVICANHLGQHWP